MKKTLDAAQETKAQQTVDSLDKELAELQIQITRLRDYILKITQ